MFNVPEARTLLLVDFPNLVYRAYYSPGYQNLTTPAGEPIGATFGVLSMTLSMIREVGASHITLAFEAKGDTFRDALFATYKAGRPPMPPEMAHQVDRATQAVGRVGWARYRAEGFEGDDVLATLAARATMFDHVYILTLDKDLQSIVDDHTSLLWPGNKVEGLIIYTPERLVSRYHLTPAQLVDRKALMGDSSDRFPGCPGIGPKTADKLLAQFGSLAAIYAHLDEVTPYPVREKLRAGEASARLCYQLATLRTDAPLTFDPAAGRLGADDRATTLAYLEALGLKSIIRRLPPVLTQ